MQRAINRQIRIIIFNLDLCAGGGEDDTVPFSFRYQRVFHIINQAVQVLDGNAVRRACSAGNSQTDLCREMGI